MYIAHAGTAQSHTYASWPPVNKSKVSSMKRYSEIGCGNRNFIFLPLAYPRKNLGAPNNTYLHKQLLL